MSVIEIRTFGGFQVSYNGKPITGFDSDKVRLLLAYLAVEPPQPQRRELLATLFWPEASKTEGRTNLRWVLSNLRKIIGDRESETPFLLVSRQTIQRNPEALFRCDVHDFLSACQQNTSSTRSLERAAHLYQGEFLAGLNPKDSLVLDEWLLMKRESLARTLVETLQNLVHCYLLRGEFHQALPHARRRVELEPWQEQGHRELIRLLEATGQRNAALAQYQQCKDFVFQTLGVEPERETTRLFEQIQQTDLSTSEVRRHNLAQLLPPLVGRQTEMDALQTRLHSPDCRAVILTGPGGVGKTHLAIEAAKLQIDNFADGVFFVDLHALEPGHSIIPAIAEALEFTFKRGDPLRTQLLNYLADKELLLVLDNFEHLQDQTEILVELLGRAPALKVVVTSRVRLSLPGGLHYPLAGLPLPNETEPTFQSSAVQLFRDTARRLIPDFDPTPEELTWIAEICRLVDGLPLGILLAAAWTEILPTEEIATAIQQNYEILATKWEGVTNQHRSIQAVLQSSWNLLDENAQQALAALSVFRGDFTRQAAQKVSGASLTTLQHLLSQSLLNWSATGRLQLHELLRQFAGEQLARSPEADQRARTRHSQFFLTALEDWIEAVRGSEQSTVLEKMNTEHNNLLAAWAWSAQQKRVALSPQIADGFCRYLWWRVRYEEGAALCHTTLRALGAAASLKPMEMRLQIRLLAWQGRFRHLLGEKEAAQQALDEAQTRLDQFIKTGEKIAFEQGLIWQMQGQTTESHDRLAAREYYMKSLESFRQAKAPWEVARTLSALGSVAWNLGNYDVAADYHRQALAARRILGDMRGIAKGSMAVGITLLHQGKLDQAAPLVEEGCRLRRQVGDRLGVADSLRNLGLTRMVMGNFSSATKLLEEAVAIYQSLGLRYGLEMAMLAAALAHRGEFEPAQVWCQRALNTSRATGYRRALGYSLLTHAELALCQNDHEEALQNLEEAEAVYQQINQLEELCRVWVAKSWWAMEREQLSTAEKVLQQAKQNVVSRRAFIPLLYLIPAMAKCQAINGGGQIAAEWMQVVSTYPLVGRSQWFACLAGDLLPQKATFTEEIDATRLWKIVDD